MDPWPPGTTGIEAHCIIDSTDERDLTFLYSSEENSRFFKLVDAEDRDH